MTDFVYLALDDAHVPLARPSGDLRRSYLGNVCAHRYVLSDPYVDVALVGMREPRFGKLNSEMSDDIAPRINVVTLHDRYVW